MTDELERLLPEEEEEPEEEEAALSGRAVWYGGNAPAKAAEQRGSSSERTARRSGSEDTEEETPSESAFAAGDEGERAAESARGLYESLTRLRRAVQTRETVEGRRERAPLTRTGGESGGSGSSLFELDQALRRDARRYDGGFTWQ